MPPLALACQYEDADLLLLCIPAAVDQLSAVKTQLQALDEMNTQHQAAQAVAQQAAEQSGALKLLVEGQRTC
jgi:hypothetical protein